MRMWSRVAAVRQGAKHELVTGALGFGVRREEAEERFAYVCGEVFGVAIEFDALVHCGLLSCYNQLTLLVEYNV